MNHHARALRADLRSHGVRLVGIGNTLRVHAPRGALTADLRATVIEHKRELLRLLEREYLQALRDLGLDVWAFDKRVEVYLPKGTAADGRYLLLTGRTHLLHFERNLVRLVDGICKAGSSLFESGDLLHFASSDNDVIDLQDRGIGRGQIWSRDEAADLLSLPYPSPKVTRSLVHLKLLRVAELVRGEVITAKRDPHKGRCLSTLFWIGKSGRATCAICHPPPSPDAVVRWSGYGRVAESSPFRHQLRGKRKRRLDLWVVHTTASGSLDATHEMLAGSVDPDRVVARIRARRTNDALRIVRAKDSTFK